MSVAFPTSIPAADREALVRRENTITKLDMFCKEAGVDTCEILLRALSPVGQFEVDEAREHEDVWRMYRDVHPDDREEVFSRVLELMVKRDVLPQ